MADGVALRINQRAYTAQEERLLAALGYMPDQASGLAVREGRRLGPGLECSISGDGLSVIVQPGVCVVNHALAAGGDYQVAIPAQVTKTLGAKPGAGQKRRDTVVVDVLDADVTQKATALREANIALLAGTPTSGTPVAPAAGTMQFEIGQVHFDGTNTPIIQATNPRFTWAVGGIGVVFSQAERNAMEDYDGQKIYRADLGIFQERAAGAWRDEGAGEPFIEVWHAAGTTRAVGADAALGWDTTERAVNGASRSGGTINLPAGEYQVAASAVGNKVGSDATPWWIKLLKNGVEIARGRSAAGSPVSAGFAKGVHIDAGDTLQLFIENPSSAASQLTITGGRANTYLTAIRVAR